MVKRDPESKKRQLLEAALKEFSEYGLAGSRIDRIAERAGCSAGLVYTYFGSKDGLFDAVLNEIVHQTVTNIPITPEDLPEYAGKLFDAHEQHPDVARVVMWHRLERGGDGQQIPGGGDAARHKIDVIRSAQEAGKLPSHFDAEQLMLLIQSIASLWTSQPPEIAELVAAKSDRARRRATVVEAVRRLLEGPSDCTT
ncbi:HTH-type transcriptional repressor [Alicyclobacillus acidoterrestris]|uniref:TetR family transcriptional regulator n=1 Tax=Alicyclobacillus suci TaxID=2816080 RepID=UPI00118EF659|nr:TetR family transcriptional regulator [Alicyclobacillus suci]GEO26901.1 HTH-type transcriptional repressor [Alicyclobacillus acidoterrestris]